MTNYEHYKSEIDKIVRIGRCVAVEEKTRRITSCNQISCSQCRFDSCGCDCDIAALAWADAEYKEPVVLTDDEKTLCKMIGRGWIARDLDGKLWWYKTKPTKRTVGTWSNRSVIVADISDAFPQCKFEFIKWGDDEPWEVQIDD